MEHRSCLLQPKARSKKQKPTARPTPVVLQAVNAPRHHGAALLTSQKKKKRKLSASPGHPRARRTVLEMPRCELTCGASWGWAPRLGAARRQQRLGMGQETAPYVCFLATSTFF